MAEYQPPIDYGVFKTACAARSLTQRELGFRVRVAEAALSAFLHGKAPLSAEKRQALARELQLDADVLFPPREVRHEA